MDKIVFITVGVAVTTLMAFVGCRRFSSVVLWKIGYPRNVEMIASYMRTGAWLPRLGIGLAAIATLLGLAAGGFDLKVLAAGIGCALYFGVLHRVARSAYVLSLMEYQRDAAEIYAEDPARQEWFENETKGWDWLGRYL